MADNQIRVRIKAPKMQIEPEIDDSGEGEVRYQSVDKVSPDAPLAEARFIEWLAVLAAGTVAALANRLFRIWERQTERGLVVDLNGEEPEFTFVENAPYGFIVVKDKGNQPAVHDFRDRPKSELSSFRRRQRDLQCVVPMLTLQRLYD